MEAPFDVLLPIYSTLCRVKHSMSIEREIFAENCLRNSDIHSYNTKRRNDFRLPRIKRNYGQQRHYQCAKEWNLLDASYKEINSLLLFTTEH